MNNPVYHALASGDRHLAQGTEKVKFFDAAVSPFVGIADDYHNGFDELFALLPEGRAVLSATPLHTRTPRGWQLLQKAQGLQMILEDWKPAPASIQPIALQEKDVEQMMELAALTKPGPFGPRTIAFGHYFGIFENGRLVAMTGQRLHVQSFTEISAVCTHPDYLGKGYAFALVQHEANLILQREQTPFLHVRKDNERAIALYQRMGFRVRGPMNFYFMKRRKRRRATV